MVHGWGLFAKTGHNPGDMICEYMGELVRPPVADVREQAAYNTLTGAGTYVFRMTAEHCVDATQAGAQW